MRLPSLWFVVPVHGRHQLTSICLRQLRRTCDTLKGEAIDATAVLIGNGSNREQLQQRLGHDLLGFGWITRNNNFLSRKFNDGIALALDPRYNPRPADYVIPCGSDDWVDWRLFTELPRGNTVFGFQHISFVREDGREMTSRFLNYPGGSGIRVYPCQVMERLGYRPADEHRKSGCDTSILYNLQHHFRLNNELFEIVHRPCDPRQIVDWKSTDQQLNAYEDLRKHRGTDVADPFEALEDVFDHDLLELMAAHYGRKDWLSAYRPKVMA